MATRSWADSLCYFGLTEDGMGGNAVDAGHGNGTITAKLMTWWEEDQATIQQAGIQGSEQFDVFFSHTGAQKHTVVSMLRREFPGYVTTFTDAWELRHGENAVAQMISTCGTCPVGIVVISPEYVKEEWPLRQLHILVDRHRRGEVGLVPLLWFDRFSDFKATVASYKQCNDHRRLWGCLLDYLTSTCMVVKSELSAQRSQPEVFGEVVTACQRHLREARVEVTGPRPISFDDQLADLVEIMRTSRKWPWLSGHGGLGKSTPATQLQHDLWAEALVRRVAVLELGFIAGSGPTMSKKEATTLLAGAVHSLEGRDCSSAAETEIRTLFAEAATRSGTLLVVDNVHSQEQLGLLLKAPLDLAHVPFVIFTSRLQQPIAGSEHADVWMQVQAKLHHHAVPPLSPEAALRLFRTNCQRPVSVSEAVEAEAVRVCGGLPLALKIMGGTLSGQIDEADWQDAARAIGTGEDPAEVVLADSELSLQRLLQHSLTAVGPKAISMFLDAACVLGGRPERDAVAVWQQWHGDRPAKAALKQLKNRDLLAVRQEQQGRRYVRYGETVLWVHDVLRWYGRRVVRGEAELEGQQHKGSRLWLHNGPVEPQAAPGEVSQVIAAELYDGGGFWPQLGSVMEANFSQAKIMFVAQDILPRYDRMASLLWWECNYNDGVDDRMGDQVASIIRSSSSMAILRCIQVYHGFSTLPDEVGRMSSLQQLDLEGCWRLDTLPATVGDLVSLQVLALNYCGGLVTLPDTLTQLSSLQTLNLGSCSKLISLPDMLGHLPSLQVLNLSYCRSLKALPDSLGQLSALQVLDLNACYSLEGLPDPLLELLDRKQMKPEPHKYYDGTTVTHWRSKYHLPGPV